MREREREEDKAKGRRRQQRQRQQQQRNCNITNGNSNVHTCTTHYTHLTIQSHSESAVQQYSFLSERENRHLMLIPCQGEGPSFSQQRLLLLWSMRGGPKSNNFGQNRATPRCSIQADVVATLSFTLSAIKRQGKEGEFLQNHSLSPGMGFDA